MLGYQNEVITSKGYINVKKHVTDYQGPARHSGERPIVIIPSIRPSVRPSETHSCPLHNFVTSYFSIL